MTRVTIAIALLSVVAAVVAWRMEHRLYLDPRWQVPTVTVLDAGAEPRAALRYQHTTPPRPFTSVTQEALITFRGVLQGEESRTPPILLHWEPAASERSWGVSTTHWRLAAAEGAQELVGAVWIVRVGKNGQLRIEPPGDMAPSAAKLAERLRRVLAWTLAVPLPDESVGKGARWTATWRAPVGVGTDVEHVATYALNDSNRAGVDLDVTCRLSGQPQRPAEHVVVDEIEGDYAGRIVLLLEEATPVQTELAFRSGMATVEAASDSGPPTDEERRRGNKIVWRGRLLLQADAIGPLHW
ncbi:MAG TPA: hypothetical protein VLC93_00355 [Myxococcota bacterium]|nr:hypothetical protein [Myxococcota bacterium]